MVPFAIAGVQMHVPAYRSNLEAVLHRLEVLMHRFPWVQMVMFSELALCGPVHNHPVCLPGAEEDALRAAAQKHGLWLIPGSIFERADDGRVFNTTPVIAPDGSVIARYRKMVPFLPYESGVTAGEPELPP